MWKKHYCLILFLVLAGMTPRAAAQIQLVINIPAFKLIVYEAGIAQYSYPISIGTELNPSKVGTTTIINKVVDPTYYPPGGKDPIPPGTDNPVGTRWLGLDWPGYGIHGTNRPDSIGSAASSGCIRLHNQDVEELADLVQIGTSVRIIYQTVLLQEDPLLHTKTITVFPDIYKQGVTPDQLEAELEHRAWGKVFWPALLASLRTPQGIPLPLPMAVPLFFEEQPLELVGVKWGEQAYIPWDLPFDPRLEFVNQVVSWDGNYFIPLELYLELTGLICSVNKGVWNLERPQAFFGSTPLGRAVLYQGETYLATSSWPKHLNPEQITILMLHGQPHFPAKLVVGLDPDEKMHLSY